MKIWLIESELEPYKGYHLKDESDLEVIRNCIDKAKRIDEWTPLLIKSNNEDKEVSDCPYFWPYCNLLMLRQRAKDVIEEKYQRYAQFLPIIDTILRSFMCG